MGEQRFLTPGMMPLVVATIIGGLTIALVLSFTRDRPAALDARLQQIEVRARQIEIKHERNEERLDTLMRLEAPRPEQKRINERIFDRLVSLEQRFYEETRAYEARLGNAMEMLSKYLAQQGVPIPPDDRR